MNVRPALPPFLLGAACGAAAGALALGAFSGPGPAPEPASAPIAPVATSARPAAPPPGEPEPAEAPAEEPAEAPAAAEPAPPPPRRDRAAAAEERPGEAERRAQWEKWRNMGEEERAAAFRKFMQDEHDRKSVEAVSRFVERNGLREADGAALYEIADAAADRMRKRLTFWSDLFAHQDRKARPEEGARIMGDLFGELADAYADVDAAYGTGWREADPELDLGQLIEPDVFFSLFRLGNAPGPNRRPPPPPRPPAP